MGEVGCERRWRLRPLGMTQLKSFSLSLSLLPARHATTRHATVCWRRVPGEGGIDERPSNQKPSRGVLQPSISSPARLRVTVFPFSVLYYSPSNGAFSLLNLHISLPFSTKKNLGYQPETHPSFMIFSFNKPGWFQSVFRTIPFQPSFVWTTIKATRILKCLYFTTLFICHHSKVENK
jgi:hypothetical protein